MATIAPQSECERWLLATLAAAQADALTTSVGTRIVRAVAPRGPPASPFPPPFVVFQFVSGRPIRVHNRVVWHQEDFQVMTMGRGSTLALEPIEEAIYARLEEAQGETTDARIIDCRRLADYENTTLEAGGERWERLGGLWRILVKPKAA